jgi:GNAT superfamily N-acetyltransferase
MTISIRPLLPGDVPAALGVFHAVGWGDRRQTVDFFGGLADSVLLVAEVRGHIAGVSGATAFGTEPTPRSGWVHNVVVHPEQRRAGVGTALTEGAMTWLESRGVRAMLLLATESGRPVYERLGFTASIRYAALECPAAATPPELPSRVRPARASDLPAILALDARATGEDRSAAIEPVVPTGWVVADGRHVTGFYLPCAWHQGPAVAEDPDSGRALIELALRLRSPAPMWVGLPESNRDALDHLAALGAIATRYATRMWIGGEPPALRAEMIYGVFNFALG